MITEELKQQVKEIIEDLIVNHNVLIFLFGSRSDFDHLCHLVVTELKEKYPNIKRIAYTCRSETCTLESERATGKKFIVILEKKKLLYLVLKKNLDINQNIHQVVQIMWNEIKR